MIGGSNRVVNLRSLWHKIQTIVVYRICSVLFYYVSIRPPQDVDVLAVLYFQIPCFRPETPALYPRSLLTNNEGRGQNENVRADFEGGNEGFKDPDQ